MIGAHSVCPDHFKCEVCNDGFYPDNLGECEPVRALQGGTAAKRPRRLRSKRTY